MFEPGQTHTEFRRRTEDALRLSEAIKSAILESALDCIITIDHEGRVLDFNPAAEKVFGYTREDAIGAEMAELIIPPRLRERHRQGILRAVTTGTDTILGRRIEISAIRKNGEEFPVELAVTRIQTAGAPIFTGHIRDITQRKRAEQELQESREFFSSVARNVSEAIFRRSPEKGLLFVNDEYMRMFGYGTTEELQKLPPELLYAEPEHRKRVIGLIENSGGFRNQEIQYRRKDGTRFWGLTSAVSIRDPVTHNLLYFDGAIVDITERKNAELRLAAQYAVTRVLADTPTLEQAAPLILQAVCESLSWDVGTLWRVDREAKLLRWIETWHRPGAKVRAFDDASRDMQFKPGAGLPGRIWQSGEPDWVPDVTKDANFPRGPVAVESNLHAAFGFPIRLGQDVLGVIEFFSREIREPNAAILEMFSTIGSQIGQFIERRAAEDSIRQLNTDLERRVVEATAELRASQERFRKSFHASPAMMTLIRVSDGCFVDVNEAFCKASGFSQEESVGKTPDQLNIWDAGEQREVFFSQLSKKGFLREQEFTFRGKGGQLDSVLVSAETVEINREPHLLTVALDLQTRKRAEAELRQALEREREYSRLKSNFVTLVSHEFRTPLGVILSSAQILETYFDRLKPDQRREHLRDVQQSAKHMAELMEQVLLLGRVEAGRVEYRPEPIQLRHLCEQLITEILTATNRVCPIQFQAKRLPAEARGDSSLVRHILINVLSNAVKYSPPGSAVVFEVERQKASAVFRVIDRGIGIPESDQKQLFESFHRASNVGQIPGTGLGMVLVKRCVELHGGTIEVDSKEAHGTTMVVTLPLFKK